MLKSFMFIVIALAISGSLAAQTITCTSQEKLWVDANKCGVTGPQGAFLSFVVKNTTGSTLTNIQVTFAGFTGTNASYFVPPTDLVRTFSSLAVNDSIGAFYYVVYADVCNHSQGGGSPYSGFTANYTVTVTTDQGSPVVRNGVLTTEELVTASAAGLAQSSVIGPGFYIGQILTQTVVYEFGNNRDIFFQPLAEAGFPDGCIRLIDAEVTAQTAGTVGFLGEHYR